MEIRGERPIPGHYLSLFDHQIRYNNDFTVLGLKCADGELIHITFTSVTCTMAY